MKGIPFNSIQFQFHFTNIRQLQFALDIRDLKFDQLRKAGFEAVIFDKDNTLSAPYVTEIHPPFEVHSSQIIIQFKDLEPNN